VEVDAGTLDQGEPEVEHVRPGFRGWIHVGSFFLFLFAAPILFVRSPSASATIFISIYVFSILSLFGVSSLFHRIKWGPVGRRRMRRLDHSTIFLAIAGSYTAIAGLALAGTTRVVVLSLVWVGALVGVTIRQLWLDAPKWVIAIPYIVVGWSALFVFPQLTHALGGWGITWLIAGGLAYTAGAIAYSAKRPNPIPGVFGYHEVFHTGTFFGAGCHYVAILFFALPVAAAH
jgi:hemolysin III